MLTVDTHASAAAVVVCGERVQGAVVDTGARVIVTLTGLAVVGRDLVPCAERLVVEEGLASVTLKRVQI